MLTDANGNYSLTGIQVLSLTGSVNFTPVAGYFQPPSQAYDLTKGTPVTINATLLSGGTIIQGVVTDSSTQAPISGAAISLGTTEGGGGGQTGPGGSYTLDASNFQEAALNGFTIDGMNASAPGYFQYEILI